MMNMLQHQAGAGLFVTQQQFGGTAPLPVRNVHLNDIVIIDEEKVVICRSAREGEPSRSQQLALSLCRDHSPGSAERIIDGLQVNSVGDVVMLLVV